MKEETHAGESRRCTRGCASYLRSRLLPQEPPQPPGPARASKQRGSRTTRPWADARGRGPWSRGAAPLGPTRGLGPVRAEGPRVPAPKRLGRRRHGALRRGTRVLGVGTRRDEEDGGSADQSDALLPEGRRERRRRGRRRPGDPGLARRRRCKRRAAGAGLVAPGCEPIFDGSGVSVTFSTRLGRRLHRTRQPRPRRPPRQRAERRPAPPRRRLR